MEKYFIDCCGGIGFDEHDGGIFTECPNCGKKVAVVNMEEYRRNNNGMDDWKAEIRMQDMMLHGLDY